METVVATTDASIASRSSELKGDFRATWGSDITQAVQNVKWGKVDIQLRDPVAFGTTRNDLDVSNTAQERI